MKRKTISPQDKYLAILGFLLVFAMIPEVHAQCVPVQIHKLLPEDGGQGGAFGGRVAIRGTTVLVSRQGDDNQNGQGAGAVYVFNAITGAQMHKLLASDGAEGDNFGRPIAISDDGSNIAIFGAAYDDDNGEGSGSAYLFDVTTGQQLAKLLPEDGAPGDNFGEGVSISGNTAIVGNHLDDDNGSESGSAYLFDVTTGQQLAKLLPNDGALGDRFGYKVGISGQIAIVGASRDDDNGSSSGSAYLFDVTTGQQLAKLLPNDGAPGDQFGIGVSISNNIAIVGAPYDDDNGDASGSAYLFDVTTGQQLHKIVPNDGAAGDQFGKWSPAIDGSVALVCSPNDDDNSGSAYLFDVTTGQQLSKILPDDGSPGDHFGIGAIDGDTVVIGAWSAGSAYLFDVSSCSSGDVVTADSFLVTRGTHVSGGVIELAASDNSDLSIRRSNSDIQARTEFEIQGVSPIASPSSLEITLEGSVFARSQVDQTIELFDYVANVWEQIDTREASRFTDSTVTVAATGDLSRLVEAGTNRIKARIRYQSLNPRQQFSSNTDQFIWTIGQ